MATTTNFGWETPDDTDLVKDGAAAIRTALGGVDTSFVDLKGGTTGQVLSKASNTDLDYTWVTTDDANAIQNAIVDAKGDLIAASAADTPARLAVGNNGETLVADSSTATGLRWQAAFPAGKNKIINGDFGIWQRGTSFTFNSTGAYTADRFECSSGGGGVAVFTRETFTPGTDPVNGYAGTYYLQANYTTSGTSTILAEQKMEDVTTFANQPMTFSFWGKVSTGTHSVSPEVVQRFGTGGSGAVVTTGTAITLTTSWARYSVTISVPAITGKTVGAGSSTSVRLNIGTSGVKTFSIWGWQAEYGSVATALQTATGNSQQELAACQRYYWRSGTGSAPVNMIQGMGYGQSITNALIQVYFPVTMRTQPVSVDYSNLALYDGTSILSASALSSQSNITSANQASLNVSATTVVAFRPYYLFNNGSASAYLGFSAEL